MAQLGARLNGIEEVEGSNPSGSTGCRISRSVYAALASYRSLTALKTGLNLYKKKNIIVEVGVVSHPAASRESEVEARQGAPGALRLVELAYRAFLRQIPPVKANPRFQVLDVDRIAGGGFRPLSRTKAASFCR